MEGNSNVEYTSSPRQDTGKRRNTLLVFIIILVILGLLAGGFFVFKDRIFPGEEVEVTPTPYLTSTPTPTEVQVNREELTLEVQNGSGIAGEASFLKEKLEELGYENIEAKNADSQNETATSVYFAPKVSTEVQSEVQDLLTELYQEVDLETTSAGSFDIEIVVGLRKGQTKVTPTKKPLSPTPTTSGSTTPTITKTVTVTPTKTPTL